MKEWIAPHTPEQLAREFINAALKSTPQTDHGVLLVVVILVLAYLAYQNWRTSRSADKRAERQEAIEEKRANDMAEREKLRDERAEQARITASNAAIAEQASREAARERVIDEARKDKADLASRFSEGLSPIISRLGDLERGASERDKALAVLTTEIQNLKTKL